MTRLRDGDTLQQLDADIKGQKPAEQAAQPDLTDDDEEDEGKNA